MNSDQEALKSMILKVLRRDSPQTAVFLEKSSIRKVHWNADPVLLVSAPSEFYRVRLSQPEDLAKLVSAVRAVLGDGVGVVITPIMAGAQR